MLGKPYWENETDAKYLSNLAVFLIGKSDFVIAKNHIRGTD